MHSYGTTLASYALTRTDSRVSSFVMVGSAGIDTALVPSLAGVHADRVFTTSATADQLAPFGAELAGRAVPNPEVAHPTSPAIGGSTRFSSDGDGGALLRVDGHNPLGEARPVPLGRVFNTVPSAGHGYFDPRTQSLKNIAAISTGNLDEVSGALSSTTADAAKHNEDAEMIQDAQPKSPRL
ncbi:hypothetical protein O159_04890 [Leifsonia xyli subsp. cynodontis DSM 46306]|uniref:DUF1023 domain-containing protein n=1 Tax=Leifsonia xyli subsp. cynodontis DSM 46306 TaxID=1389489 RepID=U3P2Z0_LEIXC|nr:hypothetical protein O159_04890 [Leifsonia xyli subsp. cynodontis DSM 46306]